MCEKLDKLHAIISKIAAEKTFEEDYEREKAFVRELQNALDSLIGGAKDAGRIELSRELLKIVQGEH